MQDGGEANRYISVRDSKVAGSNITPFKDAGNHGHYGVQDSRLSSHRGGEEAPRECIGRTRSKTVAMLLGAEVRDAPGREIGNQNGRAHVNLVMGATARAAGRDKGKEIVNTHASMMAKTTAEEVMSCVVLKHLRICLHSNLVEEPFFLIYNQFALANPFLI